MPPYWGNKPSLHLPDVIWDLKMEKEKKKFGKGRNRTPVDRIKNDYKTSFTIYATGLVRLISIFCSNLILMGGVSVNGCYQLFALSVIDTQSNIHTCT